MSALNGRRINVKYGVWALYFAFIIAMPYDVFSMTSIISLEQPSYITSYRVSVFYFSLLFLPFVIYGLFYAFRKNPKICIHPLLFIFTLVFKDIVAYLFGVISSPQLYWLSTYGNYITASLFFICVVTLYGDEIDDFIKIYAIINILTLLFSVFSGIGQEIISGRSHMSALHQGESAVVLSILAVYFGFKQKDKLNWIPIVFGVVLILATGNRKDIAYVILCVLIFMLRKRSLIPGKKSTRDHILISLAIVIVGVFVIIGSGNRLLSLFDFNRYTKAFLGIGNQGVLNFISGDDSFIGRINSFKAGIEVIKDSPILGGMFSLVDCQKRIQTYGYPTFPHSTILYLYCVMGLLAIVPIALYVKTGIKLVKLNHPLQYVFIYIFIRDSISGGANEAIKYLLLMMLILNYGMLAVKQSERKLELNDEYVKSEIH